MRPYLGPSDLPHIKHLSDAPGVGRSNSKERSPGHASAAGIVDKNCNTGLKSRDRTLCGPCIVDGRIIHERHSHRSKEGPLASNPRSAPMRKHLKALSADATPSAPVTPTQSPNLPTKSRSLQYFHTRRTYPSHFAMTPSPTALSSRHSSSHSSLRSISQEAQYYYQGDTNGGLHQALFDPYVSSSSPLPLSTQPPPQMNPYSQDTNAVGGASFYQNSPFAQPLQYHLYAPLGPHREALLPYQRVASDFFIPDALREDLQRKSAATLQTLPSMFALDRAE